MPPLDVIIGVLAATIPLVALTARWNIPYPIVLMGAGAILGFVPGVPEVRFPPDLLLLVFLPPLLYWESVGAPTDEMRANGRWIWSLAIGLVVVTVAAVAAVAHAVVPGMPWGVAFVLGAIVAPTDEIAVVPVAERLGVPRHLLAVIEGEALLNDAVSLVIYASALGVAVSGTFSPVNVGWQLLFAVAGAFAIGLAVARLALEAWKRVRDTTLQGVISLVIPFIAYEPAQRFGISGVLAVVSAGISVNQWTPLVITPEARIRAVGYWDTFVFIANAIVFALAGLQMHAIVTQTLARHPWQHVLMWAIAVNATIVVVRVLWVFGQGMIPRLRRASTHGGTEWRHLAVTAATGFRGAVSLAAALAIPIQIAGGQAFPDRDLVVFLTASVIVVTLLGGGLALPLFIHWLDVADTSEEDDDTREALEATAEAAARVVEDLAAEGAITAGQADLLRERYRHRLARARRPTPQLRDEQKRWVAAERRLVSAERHALMGLRQRGKIDNVVLRRVQNQLDLAETSLQAGDELSADALDAETE